MSTSGSLSRKPKERIQLGAAAVVLLLGLTLAGAGLGKPDLEIVESSYQMGLVRSAPAGTVEPPDAQRRYSYLAGNMTMEIHESIRGQRITIERITFITAGKSRGSAPVEQVAKLVDAEIDQPGRGARTFVQPELIKGPVRLYPLESGKLRFTAISESSFGITPGQSVSSRVEGRVGLRSFSVSAPAGVVTSLGG